jgi:hypothetical protein
MDAPLCFGYSPVLCPVTSVPLVESTTNLHLLLYVSGLNKIKIKSIFYAKLLKHVDKKKSSTYLFIKEEMVRISLL